MASQQTSSQHVASTKTAPSYSLWAAHADQSDETARGKRPRVTLACQRCKTRKQKCDGEDPCSKCRAHDHACEYVVPQKPMPFGKKQYILALERRVAELETILAKHGMAELSSDHWKTAANSSLSTSYQTQCALSESKSTHSSAATEPDDADGGEQGVFDWCEGVDPVVSVLRSLSLDVNGSGYVGASSHVALGRLFSFLGPKIDREGGISRQRSRQCSVAAHSHQEAAPTDNEEPIDLNDVPANTADRLFAGYLKHIATRWPICHSVWVRRVHQSRHSLTPAEQFERVMLHLVYATAGRFIETTGEAGPFHPKRHYVTAIRSLDIILGFNDVRTVQVLMLMAVYCLRDPVGAGAWTCSRTALLIAIDHGMHRQTKSLSELSIENELRKRLFWSCYAFDRQISIPLGRPFGISDRDIDIEMPLDISEDSTDEHLSSSNTPKSQQGSRSTSLTSFLLVVRLRRIESDIQQTVYRVDQTASIEDFVIEKFMNRLDSWKALVPQDTRRFKDNGHVPFDGYDYYMVYYFKCKRLLLYPQISKSSVAPKYLKECARACAGVCGAYKRLHQTLAVGYSIMALQTVFMAGLTLVYCLWISPDEIFDMTTSNGIHDCSIVLFVIAERVPSAKKYRNAFEVIRQRVIDQISQGSERRSREAVAGLTADLAPAAHSFNIDMPLEVDNGSFEQFSQIITDMAGEDFSFQTFGTGGNENAPPVSLSAHDQDTRQYGLFNACNDGTQDSAMDFSASFDFPMHSNLQYEDGPAFFAQQP